jgi:hypothetical protein
VRNDRLILGLQVLALVMMLGFAANALMVDDEAPANAQVSGLVCIALAVVPVALASLRR